ncbi:MAG: hypothetical protein HN576_14185 [Bacteriovoracaceae bacterium]|jgi:hypothetical protein|nr:hypothetical protein [Bacteriovoracaceae bacterium]
MKLFLAIIFVFSLQASAELSDGMKEILSLDHLKENYFLEFHNFRTMPRAPIAARVIINEEPARSFEDLLKVFTEKVLAHIPDGQTITATRNNMNKEVWRYPIGTQVIHYLTFNDEYDSVFEFRMMERVSDTRWAFGIYHKEENKFKLQHYKGLLPKEYSFVGKDGKDYSLKLNHIPLHVCQNCHNRTTSAPHQYNNLEDVGPCEFTPNNPKVKYDWVKKFTQERGYSPIQ